VSQGDSADEGPVVEWKDWKKFRMREKNGEKSCKRRKQHETGKKSSIFARCAQRNSVKL
jgi:hypothetical protein